MTASAAEISATAGATIADVGGDPTTDATGSSVVAASVDGSGTTKSPCVAMLPLLDKSSSSTYCPGSPGSTALVSQAANKQSDAESLKLSLSDEGRLTSELMRWSGSP